MLLSYLVSTNEQELLKVIREVEYGELYGVEIAAQEPELEALVSTAERDLLEVIRGGLQYIDVLTIHNGEPSIAELDYQQAGFRCRKKIKFPTVRAEG
ncbi:MAG: hypothetical protein AAGU17_10140 [Anaerolineaceae bacterium]